MLLNAQGKRLSQLSRELSRELSRLTVVNGGINGAERYSYDPLNNLKSRTAVGVTTNYNHDAANQLTEVLQGATRIKGMVYDAVGNITQKCDGNVPNFTTACSGEGGSNLRWFNSQR